MKKFIVVFFILILVFSLAACGKKGEKSSDEDSSVKSSSIVKGTDELAAQCLDKVLNAKTVDEVAKYLTDDSQEYAESILEFYEGKSFSLITATYETRFKGYDVFYYEACNSNSDEILEKGYCIMSLDGEQYLLCINAETSEEFREKFVCSLCDGTGSVSTGNKAVCAICNGTGTQYIPSAYYDAALQMWMGQTISCSGCGGAGHLGGSGTAICDGCDGKGVNFN